MFERYTEKARRAIFFARYEASQFGSPTIDTEHILLGLLREDKRLTNRLFRSHVTVESVRKQIEAHTMRGEKIATSIDLPLSSESKQVLNYAAEEAEKLGHKHIGTEHLLLGLLREENAFATTILKQLGVSLDAQRAEAAGSDPSEGGVIVSSSGTKSSTELFRDLTQTALDGGLDPLIGREAELNSLIEVLCNHRRRNALLLGESGAGKTAIVEGLAQRVAEGRVPAALHEKHILRVEPDLLVSWTWDRHFDGFLKRLGAVCSLENVILFVSGTEGFLPATTKSGMLNIAAIIRFTLHAGVQCIAAGRAAEYRTACESSPWLNEFFRPIHVGAMDAASTLLVLQAKKSRLEEFHQVVYSAEALEFAVQRAGGELFEGLLPGKALELLDAAGARVKMREGSVPEIAEQQKRVNFVAKREADAIANHEFEKARFYSEEARKEQENLEELRKRYGLTGTSSISVERSDLEDVIERWSKYPYSA